MGSTAGPLTACYYYTTLGSQDGPLIAKTATFSCGFTSWVSDTRPHMQHIQCLCAYLAGIVCLLLGIVQETGSLHLTLTKACAEVDGLLGTCWRRSQNEVIRELAQVVACELQFSLNFTHFQWLVFKVETTLLAKTFSLSFFCISLDVETGEAHPQCLCTGQVWLLLLCSCTGCISMRQRSERLGRER